MTQEELSRYFEEVKTFISNQYQTVSPQDAGFMLVDMIRTHGEAAVIGLYGFIRYATTNRMATGKIMETIGHDLNDRNDPTACPRSSSYIKFINL